MTRSVAIVGVQGVIVEVEAHLSHGLNRFTIIGLPDTVLSESRDRVRSAVLNSGEDWPEGKITVGLSPAWVRKQGSGFDLAVAAAILAVDHRVPLDRLAAAVLYAELGLDGRVRPVRGVLPAALAASGSVPRIVVADRNTAEAEQVPDLEIWSVRTLRQLIALLRGQPVPDEGPEPPGAGASDAMSADAVSGGGSDGASGERAAPPDLADVLGQYEARRALEISAAGGHHMYLQGAPGAGKTMLAERLPGILPPLSYPQALEVSTIHSVAGTLRMNQPLITRPPFCSIHHTATVSAMVGGGAGLPKPGAVSRAHHGILFLDEAPEFSRPVLDALREPIESGKVVVARAAGHAEFPAKFLLIAAANPCPCGRAGTTANLECACTSAVRRRYLARLSGPLLDRIDLRVGVHPVGRAELMTPAAVGESTATVAGRVEAARARAATRLASTPWSRNADVPGQALRSRWRAAPDALVSAERALERGTLTARGVDRVLRIAWTVADLADHDRPTRADVDTALGYRLGVTFGGA